MSFPLSCACGTLRGHLLEASAATGIRVVCYCDDCQASARWLGRDDVLDEYGGTDIFQTRPSRVRLTEGVGELRLVRLSDKGLLRWYAGCCRTPVGNTLAWPRSPFVGLVHTFMDHAADGPSRDERLGPPIGFIQGKDAIGGCPAHAHPTASAGVLLKSARFLLSGALHRSHRPTPFFDAAGAPVVTAEVLSPAARAALATA